MMKLKLSEKLFWILLSCVSVGCTTSAFLSDETVGGSIDPSTSESDDGDSDTMSGGSGTSLSLVLVGEMGGVMSFDGCLNRIRLRKEGMDLTLERMDEIDVDVDGTTQVLDQFDIEDGMYDGIDLIWESDCDNIDYSGNIDDGTIEIDDRFDISYRNFEFDVPNGMGTKITVDLPFPSMDLRDAMDEGGAISVLETELDGSVTIEP